LTQYFNCSFDVADPSSQHFATTLAIVITEQMDY